jgi:hypothetical protein
MRLEAHFDEVVSFYSLFFSLVSSHFPSVPDRRQSREADTEAAEFLRGFDHGRGKSWVLDYL